MTCNNAIKVVSWATFYWISHDWLFQPRPKKKNVNRASNVAVCTLIMGFLTSNSPLQTQMFPHNFTYHICHISHLSHLSNSRFLSRNYFHQNNFDQPKSCTWYFFKSFLKNSKILLSKISNIPEYIFFMKIFQKCFYFTSFFTLNYLYQPPCLKN